MKRETYLKHNKTINKLAKKHDIEYCTQYSYNGPKVTRTKLWWVRSSKKDIKAFIKDVKKFKFVKEVIQLTSDRIYYGDSIKVIYN